MRNIVLYYDLAHALLTQLRTRKHTSNNSHKLTWDAIKAQHKDSILYSLTCMKFQYVKTAREKEESVRFFKTLHERIRNDFRALHAAAHVVPTFL